MKKHTLLRLVAGLVSLMIAGQVHAGANNNSQVRRVRLQATSVEFSLVIAAEGTEGVGGAGTDLDPTTEEGSYCDIHFNKVEINNEDGTKSAVLAGKVVEASDPVNYGAFVKITAHTNGNVNFVFQTLTGVGSTGAYRFHWWNCHDRCFAVTTTSNSTGHGNDACQKGLLRLLSQIADLRAWG